jgi:TRAP-type uncharacterized transport system fused permease subunit
MANDGLSAPLHPGAERYFREAGQIAGLALAWSLFQLWIAQPQLRFGQDLPVPNSSQTRAIHPMFAMVLAFLACPAFSRSPRRHVPPADWARADWALAAVAGTCTVSLFLFSETLALTARSGLPTETQVILGAFAGPGHLRGSPAKAVVVGSAMSGVISGSSIANVVTTGTFTIPLMKHVGFTAEQAGSVAVASSVIGRIMPPVMGTAAFLMVEFIGISCVEVIKHGGVPAVISCIALISIVHLDALKKEMPSLGKARSVPGMLLRFLGFAVFGAGFTVLIQAMGLPEVALPGQATAIPMPGLLAVHAWQVAIAARRPNLGVDDPDDPEIIIPTMAGIHATGLHDLPPILVLLWFLMVEQPPPSRGAIRSAPASPPSSVPCAWSPCRSCSSTTPP